MMYSGTLIRDLLRSVEEAERKAEANRQVPQGCQCGNNGGGDCDWCRVYYGTETPMEAKA